MSLYQLTSGATSMGKQQAAELQKLGLLDMSKVQSVEGSNAMKTQPGAMIGYELAMKNPYEWAQQYLVPALQKTYGDDEAKRSSAVSVLGRNRNVIRMLNAFSDPGFVEQIRKDYRRCGSRLTALSSPTTKRCPAILNLPSKLLAVNTTA